MPLVSNLTSISFFDMPLGMKISVFLVFLTLSVSARADNAGLIAAMASVSDISDASIKLCKQEFPVLDAKFKGDQYNDLVARLNTPVAISEGLPALFRKFPGFIEANDYSTVDANVLSVIDIMHALDGILLAEALAGSPQREKLLQQYQWGEASLFHLMYEYQAWRGRQTR
jgi:hypothetical protein